MHLFVHVIYLFVCLFVYSFIYAGQSTFYHKILLDFQYFKLHHKLLVFINVFTYLFLIPNSVLMR